MLTPADFLAAAKQHVDPDRRLSAAEPENIRQEAVRVVTGYCCLFGASLDRKTLWDKIATALASACAKVGGEGDIDRWIDLCLEHIRAEPGNVVRLKTFTDLRESLRTRDEPWRRAFLRYVENHRFAVLAYSRARWEQIKKERELRGKSSADAGGEIKQASVAESSESFEEVDL